MTRCWVGAAGAGVPAPSATNRTKAVTSTATPAAMRTPPATRSGAQAHHGRGWRTRQPVSHQGSRPATTPGASTKKTAVPAAAIGLRTLSPPLEAGRLLAWSTAADRKLTVSEASRTAGRAALARRRLARPCGARLERAEQAAWLGLSKCHALIEGVSGHRDDQRLRWSSVVGWR